MEDIVIILKKIWKTKKYIRCTHAGFDEIYRRVRNNFKKNNRNIFSIWLSFT